MESFNIPINLIQIFLKVKKPITEFPLFQANKILWTKYSELKGYRYIFIGDDDVEQYLGEHKKFYYDLKYTWQRIDFLRYLVLNKIGGVYLDLDIEPNFDLDLFSLYQKKYIIGSWFNPKSQKYEVSNSIIGCCCGDLTSLIKYCRGQTERINSMEIYEVRKARAMLNSTGVRAFKRWCKLEKITYTPELPDYIIDHCSATWLGKDQFN